MTTAQKISAATFAALILASGVARAENWHPLDTVPKANAYIGIDHGATMAMDASCGGCHSGAGSRLYQVIDELETALPIFQQYFVMGGFNYHACGYAQVDWRTLPNATSPSTSYGSLMSRIATMKAAAAAGIMPGYCTSGEHAFPPSGGGAATGCLTPTAGCAGDFAAYNAMGNTWALTGVLINGLNIPPPPATAFLPVACDRPMPPAPIFDLQTQLLAEFGTFSWPQLSSGNASPPPGQIQTQLCTALETKFLNIQANLNSCLMAPNAFWDLTWLTTGPLNVWCDHNAMSGVMCATLPTDSPPGLHDTCVCDSTNPSCNTGASPVTACGVGGVCDPYPWNDPGMHQQVAVCELYDPAQVGAYYLGQVDNKRNGGCRENLGVLVTDGLHGQLWPVQVEGAAAMATGAYWSNAALPNIFVFKATDVFLGAVNTEQSHVTTGLVTTAYDARNLAEVEEAFATAVSRIYKGVYSGAALGTDNIQSRVAIHSMTVPGYAPAASGAPSDTWHAFHTRVSVHDVSAAGVINSTPAYETDWTSRSALSVASCVGGAKWFNVPGGGLLRDQLGPDGNFANGVPRAKTVTSGLIDRDGARDIFGAWLVTPDDTLPAASGGSVRLGRNTGFASSKPVFVGSPRETSSDPTYTIFSNAWRSRNRMLYFSDGAYVVGVHAGNYSTALGGAYGTQKTSYGYDDLTNPDAGKEMFRFRPTWITTQFPPTTTYDYRNNNLAPQQLIVGELTTRDVRIKFPVIGGPQWRTVLVGNQGRTGPGLFSVDVTDPCNPVPMASFSMPSGLYASATPTIYYWPWGGGAPSAGIKNLPAVLVPSGLNASVKRLYAFDIANGSTLGWVTLPGGGATQNYITAPVCVALRNADRIDTCYLLREDGFVARVHINQNAAGNGVFSGTVDNVTPVDGGGATLTVGASQVYTTDPVGYFDTKGVFNLVFGSGDFRNLTAATPQNYLYRAKDLQSRTAATGGNIPMRLDNVCVNNAGSTLGRIPLGPGERFLSAPAVTNDLVLFTSYETVSSGCTSGTGRLFIMNAETCMEANNANPPGNRPAAVPMAPRSGIPTTPVYHWESGRVLAGGAGKPVASQTESTGSNNFRSSRYYHRKLYFKNE